MHLESQLQELLTMRYQHGIIMMQNPSASAPAHMHSLKVRQEAKQPFEWMHDTCSFAGIARSSLRKALNCMFIGA